MLVGKRINGRYKIIDAIGGGGMSHVYLAHDMILNREVAIKILRYDFSNEKELHGRFQREALAATSLAHPNIVSIYDVGDDGDLHFIVMEYIEGKTLKQYIQEFSPVSPAKAIQIMKQLTSAISHAHEHQIIHRDIKPQNILMDHNGNVKITDFGIATTLSATSYTQTNSVIGTVHYLSPEQARGGLTSHKSDIYALGIVLYELLTGELPFSGESAVSIALKHLQTETPSVRAINAAIPQSLENVVIRATAKDPNHRYRNVDEMEADLETAVSLSRSNEKKFAVPTDDNETKVLSTVKVPPKQEEEQPNLIAPVKEQVVKKKSKMPFIIGGILLALVLAFVGYQLLKTEKIKIPNVATLSLEDATKQLEDLGFVIGEVTERNDENIEINHVIESNPGSGISREKGSEIDLVVSLGIESSEMIDYVTRQIEQVQAMLENSEFVEIIVDEVYSNLPEGEIIEQSPVAGASIIPAETTIVFKVSQGKKLVKVSNLLAYNQAALKDYERSSGLVVKIVGEENSETVPAGSVISQTPKEGVEIAEGETVQVVISKGPPEKSLKVYVKEGITILYEPNEEGAEQTVKVYIQDKTHSLVDLYEEFTITENKPYRITLQILEGEKAAYQILRDNQVILQETIPYDNIN